MSHFLTQVLNYISPFWTKAHCNMIKMARKWQKLASMRSKQISLQGRNGDTPDTESGGSNGSSRTEKGHFVVYTVDQTRFVFPIVYLGNHIFRELFKMSEEEFGLPRDGPIMLPCDAVFMNYVVFLMNRRVSEDMEKALLMSMAAISQCSLCRSLCQEESSTQHVLVCGFWMNSIPPFL